MCLGAIYWARPAAVVYACDRSDAAGAGFDDRFIYDEISLDMGSRSIPFTQTMREEALPLFTEWQEKEDAERY